MGETAKFKRDQRDEAFRAWLEAMPEALEVFFSQDVPDLPTDPYTEEGLARAEAAAMAVFASSESVRFPQNRDVADRFARFLGEVFRRNFEGRWVNVPAQPRFEFVHFGFRPLVREPYVEVDLTPASLLAAVAKRRTGHEWTFVFGHSVRRYREWVDAGRQPIGVWAEQRDKGYLDGA